MEVNRASGGNTITPSPEKQENGAAIQVAGGRISDSAGGKTSQQVANAASGVDVTPSPKKLEESVAIEVDGGRISDSIDEKICREELIQTVIAVDTSGVNTCPSSSSAKSNISTRIVVAGGTFNSGNGIPCHQEFLTVMAVDTSGVNVTPSSSAKPIKSPEITVAGGASDSGNGTTCHQCRQSKKAVAVACKNQRKNKQCGIKICDRCLWNRYGETAADIAALAEWSCPKCRGICNCSVCMKRRGYQPTGLLTKKAKASVSSDVSSNEPEKLKHENTNNDENNIENTRENSVHGDENDDFNKEDLAGDSEEEGSDTENAEIPLPVGTELSSVAGIDLRAEDVGNALQFLEFSFVFGKILELKREESEIVLRELLQGGTFSQTAQFHIHLLTLLKIEQGKESTAISPSDGENSWFQTLKNLFPESETLLKAAEYDSLDASEKLRVLNLLCNEVLGTEKVRNWIENENNGFLDKVKEAKRNVYAAKGKEKSLKQKMKDDITKAIIAKDGAPLSISEHETIVSNTKSEAAQAHAEVLESESVLMKSNKTCDALRIEPLFIEHRGNVYWKLNSSDKSYVLHQNIGNGDTLSLTEKWYTLDDAGKEIIEQHISSRRKKFRKRRAPSTPQS